MDFVEKAKEIFGKSAEVSKKAVSKAGNAIQEFSDKTVLKVDINKLESKKKDQLAEFGSYVISVMKEQDLESRFDEKALEYIKEIENISRDIQDKEKALAEFK